MPEEIVADAGETVSLDVGDGETLENILIDITASGAKFRIDARGGGWTIRNIGVRGRVEGYEGEDFACIIPQVDEGETGVMEHIYIGDGAAGPSYIGGMWCYAEEHAGTLKLREFNVGGWSDNGLYCSGPGVDDNYGMGEVHIEQSYAHDNNISGFRIGTPGSYVKDSVVDNRGEITPIPGGAINARGIWAKERDNLEIINCDITNPSGIAIQASDAGHVTVTNTRTSGSLHTKDGSTISGTTGSNPSTGAPAGVPMSPEEAANGTSSAPGQGSSGGSGGGQSGPQPLVVEIIADEGETVEYSFVADGEVVPTTTESGVSAVDESNVVIEETAQGWEVAGVTGNGFGDAFEVSGNITAWSATNPNYRLFVDGSEVSPDEISDIEYDPEPAQSGFDVTPLKVVGGLGVAYLGYKAFASE